MAFKDVNGQQIELTPAELAAFDAERANLAKPVKRLAKVEIWRRLTDAEAAQVDSMLAGRPLKKRRLFESDPFLDETDPEFPAIKTALTNLFGAARANEILAM
jgi:hypothetical protein